MARHLSHVFGLPVIHVDQLEFNPDLSKKDIKIVRAEIKSAVEKPRWILDGHGPLDLLPSHLANADRIIFLDFPIVFNIFWLLRRQWQIRLVPRSEMPAGANEWQWSHFKKMLETLYKQHRLMNPELLRILHRPENKNKLIHVQTRQQWQLLWDLQSI